MSCEDYIEDYWVVVEIKNDVRHFIGLHSEFGPGLKQDMEFPNRACFRVIGLTELFQVLYQ